MTEYLFARLDEVEDLDDDLQAQIDAITATLAGLADIVSLTPDDGAFIVGNGTVFVTESGATARTSLGLGTADSPTLTALTLSGTGLNLAATGAVDWASRGAIKAAADGILTLLNDAEDGFTRLQLGGTTSSFPGIQRSGAALAAVLADGTDVTGFNAATVIVSGGGEAEAALSRGDGLTLGSTLPVRWSDTTAYNGTPDLFLYRDSANTLALRNGTALQTLNIYGTFTDTSNYERLRIGQRTDGSFGTHYYIGAEEAGSGSLRSIALCSGPSTGDGTVFVGTTSVTIGSRGTALGWYVDTATGDWLALSDNAFDIGASGASRPRNVYVAGSVIASALTLSAGMTVDGAVVFNEAGADVDFRVEGDTATHLIFVDASTDRVGIKTSSPDATFQVTGRVGINHGSLGAVALDVFEGSASGTLATFQHNALGSGNPLVDYVIGNTPAIAYGFRISGSTSDHLTGLVQQNGDGHVSTQMLVLGAGDPRMEFVVNGVQGWTVGLDNSDSDKFKISSGNAGLGSDDRLTISTGGSVVFNEDGADADFRIEGDTEPNLFLLDAGADAIVLGHSAALGAAFASFTNIARFQVHGTSNPTSSASFSRWSADTGAAVLYLQKSRNATRGSHTVVQDADLLGVLSAGGSDGTDMAEGARITFEVDGTPGDNVMPGRILFSTSGAASEVPTERFRFGSAMAVFNEVGGDYDLRMEGDNEVNLFYLDAGNDRIGFGTASPAARVHIVDTLRFASTAATIDSDHSFYFSTYECLASAFFTLTQSEDQSDFDGGGFRDVIVVFHYDDDTTDYEALADQKVSYGIRSYVTPSTAGGLSNAQYKDFTAGTFECIGRIEWADRGVSGITASSIQYGQGIASNEFAASNPAAASTQSLSMAAVQAIVSGKKGASDASHRVRGFLATNLGKQATAAFQALSAGTDGDNGQFEYLLSGDGATVATAAIIMPASGSGNVGTKILYDTDDYTDFDRSGNLFSWVIGGSGELFLSIGTLAPVVDGGLQLGTATTQWADLFLESGALINFANGNFTLTHSSGLLTASGAVSVALGLRVGFTGAPTDDAVSIGDANFQLLFSATVPLMSFDSNDYIVFNRSSNFYDMVIGGNTKLRVDSTATAGDTALMIWDVDNATLERVTVGAAGSGGTGKKLLCINN